MFEPIDESTIAWLEDETFGQSDIDDTIAWFDKKDEALAALSECKNSFCEVGDSLVDTEIYSVIEWEIDEDGELETGTPIAHGEWEG